MRIAILQRMISICLNLRQSENRARRPLEDNMTLPATASPRSVYSSRKGLEDERRTRKPVQRPVRPKTTGPPQILAEDARVPFEPESPKFL